LESLPHSARPPSSPRLQPVPQHHPGLHRGPRTEVAHRLETRATLTRCAVSADGRVRDVLPRLLAGNRY